MIVLAIVADRNSRQKHVERARIVLLTAEGAGRLAIMRQVGCAKTTAWRWQERFAAKGVDGLLRDKSRPPGRTPLAKAVVERVIELTLGEATPRGDLLDGPGDGPGGGHLVALRAADLCGARSATAPRQALQAVQGP
jgi:Homeodomain-like domain-containing protein